MRKQRGEKEHRDVKKDMLAQFGLVDLRGMKMTWCMIGFVIHMRSMNM